MICCAGPRPGPRVKKWAVQRLQYSPLGVFVGDDLSADMGADEGADIGGDELETGGHLQPIPDQG